MPKTLYLIDGHAQIYRAYFAPFGNLSSPGGEPTRATHVFCQMLLNILRDKKPDYLAVTLDVSDSTVYRRDFFPDYKAHRDPAPEDLPVQIARIVQILQAAGIPILKKERYEADDIMATLVRRFAEQDFHTYLVSKDKDLQQLLTERVSLYDPAKDEVITPQKLVEIKGWPPELAIEAQCLIGDAVDAVPGVKGIGEKTAAKLLQKYGSAKGVIEHADELSPKQRENVLAYAPQLEISRRLLTLHHEVPIEFDLQTADVTSFTWGNVRPIFEELGFRRLPEQLPSNRHEGYTEARRHEGTETRRDEGPPEESGLDSAARSVGRASPAGRGRFESRQPAGPTLPTGAVKTAIDNPQSTIRPQSAIPNPQSSAPAREGLPVPQAGPELLVSGHYELIDSVSKLDELAKRLADQPAFAFDTETAHLSALDAELVGIALAWEVGRGYYLPVQSIYDGALPLERVRERLAPLLADPARMKVGHNLKYDLIVLRLHGMPVAGPLFDTIIAAFLLDPMQLTYGLDSLVPRVLKHNMIPISDVIGKRTAKADQLRLDQVPLAHLTEYAGEDADYTWRLKELYEPHLRDSNLRRLFYDIEMPLVSVLAEMEYNGVALDVDFLAAMGRQMAARTDELAETVWKHAGQRFNLDSTKQLAEILFDKLSMRVVRATRTGRSTDADTLAALARETQHPMLAPLLEYRELQKLRGTYVDALPLTRARRTSRVHTSYHQTGAITGRLSSSEPNLQNIPIRTDVGREIRRAFVPRSKDEVLIVADYSQVELRILAHFCGDEELIRAFAEDRDIHQFVASQVNGVPLDQVTREMRSRAKAVNFGLVYGQTAFGLSQTTGMGRNEAQAFINAYFARYPRIRGFIQQAIADARRDGFVQTMQGRRRPIRDINSRNNAARNQAERLAVNTVVQGSAAELIKIAMINLDRRIRQDKLPMRMLLQVHDELVLEAPRGEAPRLAEIVREVMSSAIELRVPLKVDVAIGENWLEAK